MKIGQVFPDLLASLEAASSFERGLHRALGDLLRLTGAAAGVLVFRVPRGEPVCVTAWRGRLGRADRAWLGALGSRPRRAIDPPEELRGPKRVWLAVPLGSPRRPVGRLGLLGRRGRVAPDALPAAFPRELGVALEHVARLHERTRRTEALNSVTRLAASSADLDEVYAAFASGLGRLVPADAVGLCLADPGRGEFSVIDLAARELRAIPPRDIRQPLAGTLLERVVTTGSLARIDDVERAPGPAPSLRAFRAQGHRAVLLVPLATPGGVLGAVALGSARPRAFHRHHEVLAAELAGPLALAIEQRRLLEERRRREGELEALYRTSQLLAERLDAAAVLDQISRSVCDLIGATGCGIGLLDPGRRVVAYRAAHGFRTDDWRTVAMPIGEGLGGLCAKTGQAIRVADVRADPRSARRDVDEREGIRSMLCVPMRAADGVSGVISAFSTAPAAFSEHDQRVLEAFADQASVSLHNAGLFEESERRGRETQALLKAGRAVSASLDVDTTIGVILEQAVAVLGVQACALLTPGSGGTELVGVAQRGMTRALSDTLRIRIGEGIAGVAYAERRPAQSVDLSADPRVLHPEVLHAGGLRSLLAVPLSVGARAIGALCVFRADVHRFSDGEVALLLALADQAALALDHARLYEEQEQRVVERTRELERQRRFVEIIVDALPLGVFVVDRSWAVIRDNREGASVLGRADRARGGFLGLFPASERGLVESFLDAAFGADAPRSAEVETAVGDQRRILRLTAVPLAPSESAAPEGPLLAVLVADMTPARRLEQRMLLVERLSTAGRLAAGVAHELNNPLATIAGCAGALRQRADADALRGLPDLEDFPEYLKVIEEEAFRCKELTSNLLQFVREPDSRREPTDLNALTERVADLLAHQARFSGRRIERVLDPALPPVMANEGQLRQVFLGLAANALEAMQPDGALRIRTRRARGEAREVAELTAVVEFADDGHGIPPEDLGRIFEPFFTTKPPGQGTGLGLAIAQGIVADHGGRIEVTSAVGQGSVFRVVLPA